MSQPVWVLSVDLQTKTATFQTGLADAAKAARGSFTDIKSGAGEMGGHVNYSMMEARHGVMLLGEEFGVHLPRALTSFISSIGPVGAAMEAAFPFLAIAVGATLLLEHLAKVREAGEKLTENQVKFGTTVQNAFNDLDKKLLQAGIRADELNENHLSALHKELQLIDHASMEDLVKSFDLVSKAAEVVFKELDSSWYTIGIGSKGATHALTLFKTEYESLLAVHKDKEASDLLAGTRKSAEHVLDLMKQAKGAVPDAPDADNMGDRTKFEAALQELKKAGVGITEKEVQAQEQLVDALQKQEGLAAKIAQLKTAQGNNAKQGTQNKLDSEEEKRWKIEADAEKRGIQDAERQREEAYRVALNKLQESEREKIDATRQGSAARLVAIDTAIKEENGKGLQETGFYRGLLTQRVNVLREITEEEKKLRAEAAKEEASNTEKMGMLSLSAAKQYLLLENSAHRVSMEERIQQEINLANSEYIIKKVALQKEINGLDESGKDYENKLKQLQNKEKQLTQQHENEITAIKQKAETERNQRVLAAFNQFNDAIARGLTQSIMGHQTWGHMLLSIGDQMIAGMLQNAIKSALMMDFGKEKDAAAAARKGYNWGMEHGGPIAPILAATTGALSFAAVMAFANGTDSVPGVGRGDVVPTMLTPGEGVVPGGVMDGLRNMARSGGFEQGQHTTIHVRPTYHVQTIDGDGMGKALAKHSDQLQRHFEGVLRKMNK